MRLEAGLHNEIDLCHAHKGQISPLHLPQTPAETRLCSRHAHGRMRTERMRQVIKASMPSCILAALVELVEAALALDHSIVALGGSVIEVIVAPVIFDDVSRTGPVGRAMATC